MEKEGQESTKLEFNCKHLTSKHLSLKNAQNTLHGSLATIRVARGGMENVGEHDNRNDHIDTMTNYYLTYHELRSVPNISSGFIISLNQDTKYKLVLVHCSVGQVRN